RIAAGSIARWWLARRSAELSAPPRKKPPAARLSSSLAMSGGRLLLDERRVEIVDHRLYPLRVLALVDRRAELRRAVQPLGIPGDVLARDARARVGPVMLEHGVVVAEHDRHLLGERRVGEALAGPQVARHLIDEPRPAVAAAPHHD